MYLEISSRQVGKTTKMYKKIFKYLNKNKNNTAIVNLHSYNYLKWFKQNFDKFLSDKNLTHKDLNIIYITCDYDIRKYCNYLNKDNVKFFSDEFVYSTINFYDLYTINPKLIYNGYFCTSINKPIMHIQDISLDNNIVFLLILNDLNYKCNIKYRYNPEMYEYNNQIFSSEMYKKFIYLYHIICNLQMSFSNNQIKVILDIFNKFDFTNNKISDLYNIFNIIRINK